ncbi:sulfurtransferase complex subunit TusD [Enterovibrio sp. ZSDZ42]|uniref:Sulfurtransferase TusD homolog n=1 Tax=Enterovibrio gelatinilyticus TaxID=2899819 RepID=A0ABT5R7V7_9GAMM|nr:sulfurtransferase complex subunit TusD [Enterovibrio sp. ZSDZ42]MDD1796357.1 sulfurtransferase complex subunit TusD [Enterovibrio sp. ZSDZ42]
MTLNYVIVVSAPVYGRQSSMTAYRFAETLVAQGHKLSKVFFYQDGVSNASSLTVPANDEFDLVSAWQALAKTHQVELETCVAAALRRGQVGEDEAKLHGLSSSNMADGFSQAGLGSLSEALLTADRVIQF